MKATSAIAQLKKRTRSDDFDLDAALHRSAAFLESYKNSPPVKLVDTSENEAVVLAIEETLKSFGGKSKVNLPNHREVFRLSYDMHVMHVMHIGTIDTIGKRPNPNCDLVRASFLKVIKERTFSLLVHSGHLPTIRSGLIRDGRNVCVKAEPPETTLSGYCNRMGYFRFEALKSIETVKCRVVDYDNQVKYSMSTSPAFNAVADNDHIDDEVRAIQRLLEELVNFEHNKEAAELLKLSSLMVVADDVVVPYRDWRQVR
ncbi:hypothetical protein P4S55_16430 [Shewanella sp. PP-Sp27a-2]